MQKLDLLVSRTLALYLNAKEKITVMAFVSKKWHNFVYCGYSWESLFSQTYDPTWNSKKLNKQLFRKFTHFRGVRDLHISKNSYCLQYLLQHANQFQDLYIHPNMREIKFLKVVCQLMLLLKENVIYNKVKSDIKGIKRLHIACYWNLIQQLREIIEAFSEQQLQNIQQITDTYNRNLIHYAVMRKGLTQLDTLQLLKQIGIDIKAEYIDHLQNTPLHYSFMNGSPQVIRQFLSDKQNNKLAGSFRNFAAKNPNVESVKLCLTLAYRMKMNINLIWISRGKNSYWRKKKPLHFASQNSNIEVIKLLIQDGEEIDIKDSRGMTALHYSAIYNFDQEIVEFFLNKTDCKQYLDIQKNSPLHYAALHNKNIKVIKLFLKNREDFYKKNIGSCTPIDLLFKNPNFTEDEIYTFLDENDLDFNDDDNDNDDNLY